jgi:hypothetical protein
VRVGGWAVAAGRGPIAADAELEALKGALGLAGRPVALPEMTFLGNFLELTHTASGVRLRFSAAAALRVWAAPGADAPPRLRVPAARAWQAARAGEMAAHGAVEVDYDW